MKEAMLLIEEWGTDILLLETALRQAISFRYSGQALGDQRPLQLQLRQARAAQALLYELLPLLA